MKNEREERRRISIGYTSRERERESVWEYLSFSLCLSPCSSFWWWPWEFYYVVLHCI